MVFIVGSTEGDHTSRKWTRTSPAGHLRFSVGGTSGAKSGPRSGARSGALAASGVAPPAPVAPPVPVAPPAPVTPPIPVAPPVPIAPPVPTALSGRPPSVTVVKIVVGSPASVSWTGGGGGTDGGSMTTTSGSPDLTRRCELHPASSKTMPATSKSARAYVHPVRFIGSSPSIEVSAARGRKNQRKTNPSLPHCNGRHAAHKPRRDRDGDVAKRHCKDATAKHKKCK